MYDITFAWDKNRYVRGRLAISSSNYIVGINKKSNIEILSKYSEQN